MPDATATSTTPGAGSGSGNGRRRLKRFAASLALTLGAIVFALVLGEIAANILVSSGIGRVNQIVGNADNMVMVSPNPDLGYVYKPNIRQRTVTTNAMGFHEQDWSPAQLAESRVILNLGDSITFGLNVSDVGHVYGKVLQDELNDDAAGGGHYVVYNAGVAGYNTWQEAALLKQLTGSIKYDMVLLGFCLNDSSPMLYVSSDVKGAVVNVPGKINSPGQIFSRQFLRRSKLFVLMIESVKSMQRRYPAAFPSSMLWHNVLIKESAWQNLENTILAMKRSLDEQGKPFVVAIFPYAHQLKLEQKDNLIQNDLMRFCQANGIRCLDLFESFRRERDRIGYDVEGTHPDDTGHSVAARAIHEYLMQSHLLAPEPMKAQAAPAR